MDLDCPHGMGRKASCVECMNEGPVGPLVKEKQHAAEWMRARYNGNCADCQGRIREGDEIGLVEGVGWCCSGCAA